MDMIYGQNNGLDLSVIETSIRNGTARQRHTDKVMAAIADYHEDRKRRTRRAVKPRRIYAGAHQSVLGVAGQAKGSQGYIGQGYY